MPAGVQLGVAAATQQGTLLDFGEQFVPAPQQAAFAQSERLFPPGCCGENRTSSGNLHRSRRFRNVHL